MPLSRPKATCSTPPKPTSRQARGRIGVRDRQTLRKLAEFDTHGIDPHQLLLDHEGHLIVANGGVPRTPADKKFDLQRMDSSLVRLDAAQRQSAAPVAARRPAPQPAPPGLEPHAGRRRRLFWASPSRPNTTMPRCAPPRRYSPSSTATG
jgi:hypothetical protein